MVGDYVGNIRIEALLGRGGMGEVYRGYDEKLERHVAVKTIPFHRMDAATKARFLREARILSKLDHPNICRIYELIEADDADYLVLELVEGETLAQAAQRHLPVADKLRIAAEITQVVAVAHGQRIVHRDLKPDNVMLGRSREVKVLDFGISRSLSADEPAESPAGRPTSDPRETVVPSDPRHTDFRTAKGRLIGTPRYMSPEQARGEEITEASDLYSLGVLLHELFTEADAYEADLSTFELLSHVSSGKTRPVTGLDADLARLIEDLESEAPADRPSASETLRRLCWIRDKPLRAKRFRNRILLAAVFALTVVATAWMAWRIAAPSPLLAAGQEGRVALLPFENDTGDPANDWVELGLMEMVVQTLGETRGVRVASPEAVRKALENRGLAARSGEAREEAIQLGRDLGAELVVRTRVLREDETFVFEYTAMNVTGSVGSRRIRGKELVAGANELSARLARRLRPEAELADFQDRFSEDGFLNRLYAMGIQAFEQQGAKTAQHHFEVCLHEDEGFDWARLRLARMELRLGGWERSEELLGRVLSGARGKQDQRLEAECLDSLGNLAASRGDYDQAERWAGEALTVRRRLGDRHGEAATLQVIGKSALLRGELDRAGQVLEQALELATRTGDRQLEESILNTTGVLHLNQQQYDEAARFFARTRDVAVELGDRRMELMALGNLGTIAMIEEDFPEAESLLSRFLEFARESGDRPNELTTLNNLALVALRRGDYEQAEKGFAEVVALAEELGANETLALASANLALTLLELRRPEEALPHLRKLQNVASWAREAPEALAIEARYEYEMGNFKRAARIFEKAIDLAGSEVDEDRRALDEVYRRAARLGRRLPLPGETETSPVPPR